MRQMLITFDQYCLFSLYHLIKGDLINLMILGLWCLCPKGPPDTGGGSESTLFHHHAKTGLVFSTLMVFAH